MTTDAPQEDVVIRGDLVRELSTQAGVRLSEEILINAIKSYMSADEVLNLLFNTAGIAISATLKVMFAKGYTEVALGIGQHIQSIVDANAPTDENTENAPTE